MAEAICEAASRPNMHFVAAKTIEQQDIQAIHRVREGAIVARTAITNQARGLLAEYGIVLLQGIRHLRNKLPEIIQDPKNELTENGRTLFAGLYDELARLDYRIKIYDQNLERIYNGSEVCRKLGEIEGLGIISSTALVAAIGDVTVFKNGRQMSAWLGLTPKQYSSGNKNLLLGISKRGDCYIRKLLLHGARSVVYRARNKEDHTIKWLNSVVKSCGINKACIALANKNARIVWALLKTGKAYAIAA